MARHSTMRTRLWRVGAVWLLAGLGLVPGCRTTAAGGSATCQVRVMVEAAPVVNQDRLGRSLPTVVRFYQLRGLTRLEDATFEDIWERAGDTLADDLLDTRETTIYPGEQQPHTFAIASGALYMAAVAIFREPAGHSWRAVVPLSSDRCDPDEPQGPYFFQLQDNRLRLLEEAPAAVTLLGPGPRAGATPNRRGQK